MDFNKLQLIAEEIDKYTFSNDKDSLENKLIELKKLNFKDSSLQSILYYFIGNILSSLRRINHIKENSNIWNIEQKELFNEIYYYRKSIREEGFDNLQLEYKLYIYTNLANAFSHYGRTVNALKYYDKALSLYPSFEMALINKAECLKSYSRLSYDWSHKEILLKKSYDTYQIGAEVLYNILQEREDEYYSNILSNTMLDIIEIEEVLGKEFLAQEYDLNSYPLRNYKNEIAYREWALKNTLFLNPMNDLGLNSIATHDPLHMPDMITEIKNGFPRYIIHFNQMKQEYISYRHLLFEGINSLTKKYYDKDTHIVYDYDYNLYDINIEKIKLAFKGFYSLFDKIAFFINDYYDLGLDKERVDFRRVWYIKNDINPKFDNFENLALRGLFLISKDLFFNNQDEDSKEYIDVLEPNAKEINKIRNYLEHKFIMIKLLDVENFEQIKDRERYFYITEEDLINKTIYLGQLLRESLIYLSFSVHKVERSKHNDGKYLPINLSISK